MDIDNFLHKPTSKNLVDGIFEHGLSYLTLDHLNSAGEHNRIRFLGGYVEELRARSKEETLSNFHWLLQAVLEFSPPREDLIFQFIETTWKNSTSPISNGNIAQMLSVSLFQLFHETFFILIALASDISKWIKLFIRLFR